MVLLTWLLSSCKMGLIQTSDLMGSVGISLMTWSLELHLWVKQF